MQYPLLNITFCQFMVFWKLIYFSNKKCLIFRCEKLVNSHLDRLEIGEFVSIEKIL